MDWTPGGRSGDLEDRRGDSGGFGGFGLPHIGIGGFVILAILSLVFHRNFFALLNGGPVGTEPTTASRPLNDPGEEREVQFVSFVLDDVQKTWTHVFAEQNRPYRHAKLVLFRDAIQSACGMAQSATGPFYCPADQKVYLDLGFFDELKRRFGAPGEFAQAYVIAHELGHHVQNLLGTEQTVEGAMHSGSRTQRNAMSVRLELQADCYAGVWGHTTQQRKMVDQNDFKQAMTAAAAVGDDRLERMAGQSVSPESFTHGSSEQRMHWFQQGFTTGDLSACNTFAQ
jgi:predicted metalloprotease